MPEPNHRRRERGGPINDRDRAIIEAVQRFGQLHAGQIRRLFFAGHRSEASRQSRCRAVLQRLYEAKLLDHMERTIGGRPGSDGHTYLLPAPGKPRRRRRAPNLHRLDIAVDLPPEAGHLP